MGRKLTILTYQDPFLRKRCRNIELTEERIDKIKRMFKLMYESGGIGLAAPQVGWDANLFIVNTTGNSEDELVFLNPLIISESLTLVNFREGCLSFPDVVADIERPDKITIEFSSLDGTSRRDVDGLLARVIQHEYDHCQGKVFIDKAKKLYKRTKSDI